MNVSNNSYINLLQNDHLPSIFSYLPLRDKLQIIPRVSKSWHSIIEIQLKEFYVQFAKEALKKEIELYKFSDLQTDLIIDMVRKNHFISLVEIGASSFSFNRSDFFNSNKEIITEESIYYFNSCPVIFFFNLSHKEMILNETDKKVNFKASMVIEVAVHMLRYKNNFAKNGYRIHAAHLKTCEEKGLFSWNKLDVKKIKPLQPKNLISHAIYLQLQLYIAYFAELNMLTLSGVKLDDFKGNYPHVSFKCNQFGQIMSDVSNQKSSILLVIEKKKVAENAFVMIWQSDDKQGQSKTSYKINDLLRWSIFSETIERLSKKLLGD